MQTRNWHQAVSECEARGQAYVLATVLGAAGSTPREPSTKMVITADGTFDTVGGGQLEFLIIQRARTMIANQMTEQVVEAFPLAADAKQCCGGFMSVLLESFNACDWQINVFGAGHVAHKLLPLLAELKCQVNWFDNRSDWLIEDLASNINCQGFESPMQAIEQLADNSDVLILTHDHGLDYELTHHALKQQRFHSIGTIGSATKSERFRQRLLNDGFNETHLENWNCPVGITEIKGKLPIEVAISIAGQLIAHQPVQSKPTKRGVRWKDMKEMIKDSEVIVHD